MRIANPAEARRGGSSEHRPGGIAFTYLLEGEEFAPDNHCLMLVHVAERYRAPRHRHNFEQVRVMLDGRFGFGPGRVQGPGSIGYFTEGTWYAQDGEGASTTLLLQVAGASGHGYMSERQMRDGVAALGSRGDFHDGVFTRRDAAGKKHHQDGYEAVWEHVFERPIAYPRPRYDGPVLIDPAQFAWLPLDGQPGVAEKRLAGFNERGLSLSGWRLDAGAGGAMAGAGRRSLAYVLRGDATTATGGSLAAGWAFELLGGDRLELSAGAAGLELLRFTLPQF